MYMICDKLLTTVLCCTISERWKGNFITLFLCMLTASYVQCKQVLPFSEDNSLSIPKVHKTVKRSITVTCEVNSDCKYAQPGSLCINNVCKCPQGYLPTFGGQVGCFDSGQHFGDFCNASIPCKDDTVCVNDVCLCPEGFQVLHLEGTNLCLLWHKPIKLNDRCHSSEDCLAFDRNSMCRKRWCQCRDGYQLFETMLFGLRHRCFKTYKKQCYNFGHCSTISEATNQHCVCQLGYCHCTPNFNLTVLEVSGWMRENPTLYQYWKKDIILATRLLFITIILFFVPCFVYVTLRVRERSRSSYPRGVRPVMNPITPIQSTRNRNGNTFSYPMAVYIPATHNIEFVTSTQDTSSRETGRETNNPLIHNAPASENVRNLNISQNREVQKDEDSPPAYDDIMRVGRVADTPPPPYTTPNRKCQ